jgi:hypothetical protein
LLLRVSSLVNVFDVAFSVRFRPFFCHLGMLGHSVPCFSGSQVSFPHTGQQGYLGRGSLAGGSVSEGLDLWRAHSFKAPVGERRRQPAPSPLSPLPRQR